MNRSKVVFGLGVLICCVFAMSNFAIAQEFRGTITGNITDPNGANVPGASVTVKNTATNIKNTVTTNDEGSYTVPLLQPGIYTISVTMNGFKTSTKENVNLGVSDRLTIDLQLSIGSTTEVDIVANEELLDRSSVSSGTTISSRQIEELPLPEGAVTTLVTQAPGVNYTGNPQFTGPTANGNLAAFRTNGAAGNQINLDGSPNLGSSGAVAFTPPSSAVGEFKVQTNKFDAQDGYTAGSTVNVSLRSGTNKFHGEAYFYDRDKSRTANNFFSNRAGIGRGDRKYNRYGGMLNGPIFKDRTFFIFTYENQKDNIGEPTTFRVPTALQRTGDFSEILSTTPIFDPGTGVLTAGVVNRTAFTGNIIPTGRLNAAAVRYLNLFPLPNQPTVNGIGTFFSNMNLIRPYQSYLGKIDHNFNSNNRIFGRYYYSKSSEDRYNWLGKEDSPTRGFEYRVNKGLGLNYTSTLSSHFILDLRGSYTLFSQERRNANPISPSDLGLSSAFVTSTRGSTVIPRFDFTSFNTASIANAIGSNRSDYNEGLLRPFKVISVQPTMTQIAGNHTFRYGYDYRRLLETFDSKGFNSGRFLFDGTYTAPASNSSTALRAAYGRDLAAFLLGIPTASGTSLIDNPTIYDVNSQYQAAFFQDDWRITDRLTVNLGLRYEIESGVVDSQNRLVRGFDTVSANPLQAAAQTNFTALPPASVPTTFNVRGGLLFSDSTNPASQTTDKNNFQPRVGISYSIDDKTVVRGGYGMFVAPFQIQTPNQSGFSTPTLFVPSVDNGLTFVATLNNPFPGGIADSPGSSQGLATFIGRDLSINRFERQNALYHRFTVGVQRELPWKLGLEATYVFSRGTNLATTRNINSIPTQYLNNGAEFSAAVSTFLGANVSNPFRGLVPSNPTYNAATIARRLLLVPFPQFGNINITDYNGRSNYNSLQLQLIKRFANGLSLNGSYTYTNERETTNYLNPQDAEPTEGISPNERPNRFTFSSIYELPIGKGRALGKDWNPWLDAFIGGWQLQANYEWQSGEPLVFGNVYFNGNYKDLKSLLGKKDSEGRRYGIDIPAFEVSRFYPAGTVFNGTAPASIGVGNNTTIGGSNTLRYFPQVFNGLRNQRFLNFNMGLSKNFRIREKMKLQFRFEAINALNRPYFSGLGLNPATMPNLITPGSNNLGRFGFANTQRQPPRDFQLGARFTF